MAGIMDLFRTQQPQTKTDGGQQTQQSNNSGGQQTNQQPVQGNQGQSGIQGPGTTPNNSGQGGGSGNGNAETQGEAKGIDRFAKIWDTTDSQSATAAPSFNLDPKILREVAGSQDFMQGLDPELIKKATSGDIPSLMQLINGVGQNAYARSLEHGGTLTDRFVGAREAHSSKSLSKNVRGELTTHALSAIPNFKHPAVQRQLKDTAERLQTMHPDAPPQEIAQMAIEYYHELVNAISGDSKDGKTAKKNEAAKQTNWDQWFAEAEQQQDS